LSRVALAVVLGPREHGIELCAHGAPVVLEPVLEASSIAEAHRRSQRGPLVTFPRQLLGLPIIAVLQPVLEPAQEDVRIVQPLGRPVGNDLAGAERLERCQRCPKA